MLNPKVSIIIPVYNAEETIQRCIESVICQTEKNWELLLIDDGSHDGSRDICVSYVKSDTRISVIHKENGGVSSARNAGLNVAKGEYITFIDADDYIKETFLEKMLAHSPADLIICGFYNPQGKDFVPNEFNGNIALNGEFLKKLIEDPFYLDTPWCKLFKRNIIRKTRLSFDEDLRLSEDTLFSYQYIKECLDVSVIPNKLYIYDGLWGGGSKYTLTTEQLMDASCKNVAAIKAVADKFGVKIETRYKCFQYTKLENIFKNYIDKDIYELYILSHDNITIENYLGDERLSPISYAVSILSEFAKFGNTNDCRNLLIDLNRFITTPIKKINFSNNKHFFLLFALSLIGARITATLLTFIMNSRKSH